MAPAHGHHDTSFSTTTSAIDLSSSTSSLLSTATSPPLNRLNSCPVILRYTLLLIFFIAGFLLSCYYVAVFVSANSVLTHSSSLPSYTLTSVPLFNRDSFAALFTVKNPSPILPFNLDSSDELLLSYRGARIGAGAVDGAYIDAESSERVLASGRLLHGAEEVVAEGYDRAVELGVEFNVSSRVGNRMYRFGQKFYVACNVTVDRLMEGARVLDSSCDTYYQL